MNDFIDTELAALLSTDLFLPDFDQTKEVRIAVEGGARVTCCTRDYYFSV